MTNLEFERRERGLSLRELGLRLAFSAMHISRLERGMIAIDRVSGTLRGALEAEFRQSLEWLLAEVERKAACLQ